MTVFQNIQMILIVLLIIAAGWLMLRVSSLEDTVAELEEPDLYTVMSNMQNQAHKLYFAIESENSELTDFYLHELEEAAEELIEANLVYADQPVGMLTQSMLLPVIEEMEDLLDDGYWDRLREKRTVLTRACNDCHGATGFPSIIITERGEVNPFNQDFRVR